MAMKKKHIASFAFLLWFFIVAQFMILSSFIDLELYFELGLLGLLIIVELANTPFAKPRYILRLQYVIAAGIVVFGIIIARKVLEILAS